MKQRLLWKLLIINVAPVIVVIIVVVWVAIDQLAADYFMVLMDKYAVSPTETHQMFLDAIHRYLLWATLAALLLAFILSFILTRHVLKPLAQMAEVTQQVAAGNFSTRVSMRSEDEVGQLALAFNHMADSLEQLEFLRKSMVADVAHELRTPLTNLRGYLEGLSDEVIQPSRETIQLLEGEVMRLVSLIENLQQLAKADAARVYLQRSRIDLPKLIDQVLALITRDLSTKQIRVTTDFAAEAQSLYADRDKILQAVRNLLENACKYSPQGGQVKITSKREQDLVKVTFANSGPAIPAEALPYIFERFYRVDRSRSRTAGGACIGLAIVRELIEAHGGQVGAESDDLQTCIWFSLPAATT
jgi:two-component system sensor histidine kinase BaeS